MKSETITIPWDGGTQAFNRDVLGTAVLLWLDQPADRDGRMGAGVARALRAEYGMGWADAIFYATAAKICIREGIEH